MGDFNQYSITWGAKDLREEVKHKLRFTFSKKEETLMEAARRLEGLKL